MASSGSRVIGARRVVQVVFFVIVLVIGAQLALWAGAHSAGRPPAVGRPAGVEGFLPISALMSLRLLLGGQGVHPVHPAGLAILLGILAMSLVLAKSFCSLLCPVGAVSEWLGRLGVRVLGRQYTLPRVLDVPLRGLKFVLLAFFVWATWAAMDLAGVRAFLDSPYNRVADVKMLLFFAHPGRLTIAVLGVLAVASVLVRDAWCRYLCPYGALLGLVGRLAPLKVTRDAATCIDCRACTRVCPARLQVHALVRVASVECTSCQDCVAACPVKGCLEVRPPRWWRQGWAVRPVAAVTVGVVVYLALCGAFRAAGMWHGAVTEAEYAEHIRNIDSPLYTHVGGMSGGSAPPASGR
jgi:polyferredoxin